MPWRSNISTSSTIGAPARTSAATAWARAAMRFGQRDLGRDLEGERGRIRRRHRRRHLGGGAEFGRERGQRQGVHAAAFGMQVEPSLRELGHLGEAAGEGQPLHRMAPQVFQHAADEVAHVDEGEVRQRVMRLDRSSEVRPVAAATWVRPVARATSMPRWMRVDPGGAGIRDDDARGAEDREPAANAQPPVQRRSARISPPGMAISTTQSAPNSARVVRIICRGTGLIAGSPGGTGRPGRVTVPTPSPAWKRIPVPGAPGRQRDADQRAMGHVRIVAGILDDADYGGARRQPRLSQGEGGGAAAWQAYGNGIGELAASAALRRPRVWRRWRRRRWSSRDGEGAHPQPRS